MKQLITLLAVVLGTVSMTYAQATTMPAADASLNDGPVKVLVIPFAEIGQGAGHGWVGAALQENLTNAVAGDPAVLAVQFDHPISGSDIQQITTTARDRGATLVVFGAYQCSGTDLRVTGRIIDINFGRDVGTLKATGALADLFKIEDTLGTQVQAALPAPPANPPVVAANTSDQTAQPSALPPYTGPSQAPVDQQTATAPTYDTSGAYAGSGYYSYPPTYAYPYSYGYPSYYYGGFPLVIGGGWGYRGGYYPRGYWGGYRYGGPVFHPGFSGGFRGGFSAGGGFHGGFAGGGHR
jgi:TolB-like protein